MRLSKALWACTWAQAWILCCVLGEPTASPTPAPTPAPSPAPSIATSVEPTPEPSAVSSHYVARGAVDNGAFTYDIAFYCQDDLVNQATYSSSGPNGDNIGVSCCSDALDGTVTGHRPNCNAGPATYQEAVSVCSGSGYRLCTLQEMLLLKTKGQGCQYDSAYNWVSDSCGWC